MKVLVTGANGYIGQGVVKQLLDNGHHVIATDYSGINIDNRAEVVITDLFAIDEPYVFFNKPDVIIHLAWRDGFRHNSNCHIDDLSKHYMFLKKLIEQGISQVCCMGSVHEIGFFEGCVDENTATNPQSLYGISKNALRQSIEILQNDNKFCFQWIRGYYIVGNSEYGCSIFSKITQAEHSGEIFFPFTTGENQFDFIDYEEFCLQVCSVIEQQEVTGIINCCKGNPIKIKERVEQFIEEKGYRIKLEYGAFPDRPYDSKAIWGSTKKIEQILNARKKNI